MRLLCKGLLLPAGCVRQPASSRKNYKEIDVHIVHLNGQQATIKPPYTGLTSVYAFQLLAYGIWPKSTP